MIEHLKLKVAGIALSTGAVVVLTFAFQPSPPPSRTDPETGVLSPANHSGVARHAAETATNDRVPPGRVALAPAGAAVSVASATNARLFPPLTASLAALDRPQSVGRSISASSTDAQVVEGVQSPSPALAASPNAELQSPVPFPILDPKSTTENKSVTQASRMPAEFGGAGGTPAPPWIPDRLSYLRLSPKAPPPLTGSLPSSEPIQQKPSTAEVRAAEARLPASAPEASHLKTAEQQTTGQHRTSPAESTRSRVFPKDCTPSATDFLPKPAVGKCRVRVGAVPLEQQLIVDGTRISSFDLASQELDPGTHHFRVETFAACVEFVLDMAPDALVYAIWDFEKGTWRHLQCRVGDRSRSLNPAIQACSPESP